MDLTKREKLGLTIFAIILLTLISIMYFNKNNSVEVLSKNTVETSNNQDSNNSNTISNQTNGTITVYINGEINKPGVYKLLDGDRAEKLIELAGGFNKNADTSSLNLAMKLKDEDFIRIPSKLQNVQTASNTTTITNSGNLTAAALININTADKEQLKELPRIGDALSQRILDYRNKMGNFKDIKDLRNVSGIGPKMFENIKDKITVH